MVNVLFSTNSGFLASTLVENIREDIKISVVKPDDLYFSIDQGALKNMDLIVLAGNMTFGEKTISKIKETGVKHIIDGTIVIDKDRLSKLKYFNNKKIETDYLKVPLPETFLVYTISKLFEKLEIKEMFTSLMLSASHYGDEGVEEITNQTIAIFNQEEVKARLFRERLAFNLIPLVNKKDSAGYLTGVNKELDVLMKENILKPFLYNMQVVLAPTLSSTGAIFTIRTKKEINSSTLLSLFEAKPGDFEVYKDESIVPVNSTINDGKIHVASLSVIDKYTVSFYVVADDVWTLSVSNFVKCLETIV